MATRQVTAAELKVLDPRRFKREYTEWTNDAPWDGWYETIEEEFKADVKAFGVKVDNITYSGLGYDAEAAFYGRIVLSTFMEQMKIDDVPLSELHPALYLAVKYDGSYARIAVSRNGLPYATFEEHTAGVPPVGIFSGLDREDWQALIDEQWGACDPHTQIEDFLRDLCHGLARDLDAEYTDLMSEANFLESCEANEITFELEVEDESELCA